MDVDSLVTKLSEITISKTAIPEVSEGEAENRGESASIHSSQFSTESRHLVGNGLKIAAFNVETFGTAKMEKKDVVNVLVRIIQRYDCILIQEIKDKSEEAIKDLLKEVKVSSPDFKMVLSPRVGNQTSYHKEQYAFFYRPSRLTVEESLLYVDENGIYERQPFAVKFKTHYLPTDNDEDMFIIIGVHLKHSNAVSELAALDDVAKWAEKKLRTKYCVIAGDFNAGGSYVTQAALSKIPLRTATKKYKWLINDRNNTSTSSSTSAAYDRIVVSANMIDFISQAGVLRFDEEIGLIGIQICDTYDLLKKISNHYPVEMTMKPKIAISTRRQSY